jgi:hypothetical protein
LEFGFSGTRLGSSQNLGVGWDQTEDLSNQKPVVAKSGTSWDKRHVYPAFETTPHFVIFFEELHQCHYSIAIAILKRN